MIPLLAAIGAIGNVASSAVSQWSHLGATASSGGSAAGPASGSFADVLSAHGVGSSAPADPVARPVGG
jgi:hypothetical protein